MFAFSLRGAVNAARPALVVLVGCGLALEVGGCASTNAGYPATVTPAAYVAEGPSVQVEGDGLPVQAAPSAKIRQQFDDPTQPFSPNYGGVNPARIAPAQPLVKASNDVGAENARVPSDLPPAFRRQLIFVTDPTG